jgi:hypothetical protein
LPEDQNQYEKKFLESPETLVKRGNYFWPGIADKERALRKSYCLISAKRF